MSENNQTLEHAFRLWAENTTIARLDSIDLDIIHRLGIAHNGNRDWSKYTHDEDMDSSYMWYLSKMKGIAPAARMLMIAMHGFAEENFE